MECNKEDLNNTYTDFNELKKTGDQGEELVADLLRVRGHGEIQNILEVYEEENLNLSDWDIRARNKDGALITYEVKMQPECAQWCAVNVEQIQSGKPAGIATSKADYWIFVNPELGMGLIDAADLKEIHWRLQKDPTVTRDSYIMKERRGEVQLWITGYKNFACGWRMSTDKLKWYQHNK